MIQIFVIGVLWYLQSLIFSVKNRSKIGQKYLKNGPIFGHFGTKIYRPFYGNLKLRYRSETKNPSKT